MSDGCKQNPAAVDCGARLGSSIEITQGPPGKSISYPSRGCTMIAALICGTMFCNPEQRNAKSGQPCVAATLRIRNGEGSQFARATAFSDSAKSELLRLQDGCGRHPRAAQNRALRCFGRRDKDFAFDPLQITFSPYDKCRRAARPRLLRCPMPAPRKNASAALGALNDGGCADER
jgi:hypothetical protein